MDMKIKYGFIFSGYKLDSYYYEVVIQFRKVILICVAVVLSVVSPEIQGLCSFFVLAASIGY